MTTYHAHLGSALAEDLLDDLRAQLDPTIALTVGDDVPPTTQALVAGRPTPEQLAASPTLELLLIPWAGLPTETRNRLVAFPNVAVHNLHHNAAVTAEMAIALLLACARGVVPAHNHFIHGDWTYRSSKELPSVTLSGKTALILGYGEVGQRIGAVCGSLGMQVIGVRRTPSPQPDVYTPDALPDVLPKAHVLVIALPGTPETEAMIGSKELAALPDGAILVNIGRAAIVDELALYEALRDGKLHGAGLDVWYIYPRGEADPTATFPAQHPFWQLDNVVMSPHRGGGLHNLDVEHLRIEGIAAALNAAARGQPVPHPVDPKRGY